MSRTNNELLKEALLHLPTAQAYSARDLSDEAILDAIALRLAAMIDSLNRLPASTLDDYFGATWGLMRGMRNRIVHGYMTVNASIIRVTVSDELPEIERALNRALADSDHGSA